MGQPQQSDATDVPITTSWSSDWAAAEKAADDRAEQKKKERQGDEEQGQAHGTDDPDSGQDSSDKEPERTEESGGQELGGVDGEEPREGRVQRDEPEVGDAPTRAERVKAFRQEATDLGFSYEGNGVTVADRAKFREENRQAKQKLTARQAEFEQEWQQRSAQFGEQVEKAQALHQAIEANDPDALAVLMGHKGWNEMSESIMKAHLAPEHQELSKLKREKREGEARDRQRQADYQKQAKAREHVEARNGYRQQVQTDIAASKKYKQFATDPHFASAVMAHQEKEWDGEETISFEIACERARVDAKAVYDRLHSTFGTRTAKTSEREPSDGARSVEKPGNTRPPKSISQQQVAGASAREHSTGLDEEAWNKKWSAMIRQSTTPS